MKHSEWTIYRSRRLWTGLLVGEGVFFLLAYWFLRGDAFFLLGPFILYNLIIYFFPYWYSALIDGNSSKGPKFQQIRRLAGTIFPAPVRVHLRLLESDFANILIFAHGNSLWITTSAEFVEAFTEAELEKLLTEIYQLHRLGRLHTATLLSALQFALPFGFWGHNRGSELVFFAPSNDPAWQQLTFRVFHWQTNRPAPVRTSLVPCLFYPALTKYSPASYFSAYNFLREKLIKSLKPSEESIYGE